jgi:hypothetical protein
MDEARFREFLDDRLVAATRERCRTLRVCKTWRTRGINCQILKLIQPAGSVRGADAGATVFAQQQVHGPRSQGSVRLEP